MTVARVLKAKSTKLDSCLWYRSCKRDFIMTLLTRPTVVRPAKKISYNSLSAAIHLLMIQPYLYIRRRTRKLLWRINAIPNKWKACCFYGGYSIAQEDRCQWLPRAPEPHPQRVIVIHYVLFDIKVSFCFMELSSVRVCIKINYTIKYVHSYRLMGGFF